MKIWLKWGLWFAGVYTILLALSFLFLFDADFFVLVIMPGYWLYEIIGYHFRMSSTLKLTLYAIVSILILFGICSIIGKIKSKYSSHGDNSPPKK